MDMKYKYPGTHSIAAEIKALARLLDNGVIDREEAGEKLREYAIMLEAKAPTFENVPLGGINDVATEAIRMQWEKNREIRKA